MNVEWFFLCEDCKMEVILGGGERFSLSKMGRLGEDQLRKCTEVVEKLRGFQKRGGGRRSTLDRLGMLLSLLLEHRDHDAMLYNSSQDVRTENLPWFERWSWKEDITSLEPSPVAKDGWKRGLSLEDAVGENDDI